MRHHQDDWSGLGFTNHFHVPRYIVRVQNEVNKIGVSPEGAQFKMLHVPFTTQNFLTRDKSSNQVHSFLSQRW